MKPILIGIHGDDPAGTARTRKALASAGVEGAEVIELGRGGPAAFDALARRLLAGEERAMIFLEAGALPAPDALGRMLALLDRESGRAVLGPSTNIAWNEQGAFPAVRHAADLAATGRRAERRFVNEVRSLDPLHSLGDFCMVVARQVVEVVGGAEPEFGDGPCWEMEWNARAHRAGFPGYWVGAAFVYRPPVPRARRAAENRHRHRNRRLYQDLLCGRRLRGEGGPYRSHCRGDACPNFAPPGLIRIGRPLEGEPINEEERSGRITLEKARDCTDSEEECGNLEKGALFRVQVSGSIVDGGNDELVSCLMPTRDRRAHVPWAIDAFLRQDYPWKELVILDDGDDPVADLVPADSRIRYLRPEASSSLGAKRNRACEAARGEILVHWDDDDWHAPWRLSYQVRELLGREVEVCGLDRLIFFDPGAERAWRYVYPSGSRPWVAGGTLCYRRRYWRRHPFPDKNVGEDNAFAWGVPAGKLGILADDRFYVARVHAGNTSPKRTGGRRWQPIPLAEAVSILGDETARVWRELASGREMRPAASTASAPRVSCLMPTRERRRFVGRAIAYFLRQTYTDAELLVVEDGGDSVADLIPPDPRVRYLRIDGRLTVGEKRNRSCEEARGEIVVHWDDDDWFAADRLAAQVEPIDAGRADVTALAMRHVLALGERAAPHDAARFVAASSIQAHPGLTAWSCPPALHARLHYRDLCCGTIAYPRRLWRGRSYPAVDLAEDVGFLETLPPSTRFLRLPREDLFVCVRHGSNTWSLPAHLARAGGGSRHHVWHPVDPATLLPAEDLEHYRRLAMAPWARAG
ncbi:MAG: glycosyltransferase family 2 protein [Holophagales bacterium]|nr:glycosyltransferase family 2 protein [Holophagales bacterium]